ATDTSRFLQAQTQPSPGQLRIPSRIATRLRMVETNLNVLAARSSGGVVDGVLSILSGSLILTLAVVLHDDENVRPGFLYVYGGAAVARGGLQIALSPDPADASIQYAHLPMGTPREVIQRLRFG